MFIQRLKEIDNSFTNPNMVKYDDIVNEGEYLILIRPEYNNDLEAMSNAELVNYFNSNGSEKLMTTICTVLKEFHYNNFYHGGIKLSNILMYYNTGDYLIADHSMKYLNENMLIALEDTVNYISPEEIEGREITTSIDIWALGVLLYKIKSGIYPFESKTLFKTQCNILRNDFLLLREVENSEMFNQLFSRIFVSDLNRRLTVDEIQNQIEICNSNDSNSSNNNNYLLKPTVIIQQPHQQQQYQQQQQYERNEIENDEMLMNNRENSDLLQTLLSPIKSPIKSQQQQQQQQYQQQQQQQHDRMEINDDEMLMNNRRYSDLHQSLLSPIKSPPVVEISNNYSPDMQQRRKSQYYQDTLISDNNNYNNNNKDYSNLSKKVSPITSPQKQQHQQDEEEDINNYKNTVIQKFCYFTEDYKSSGIRISNNGQTIKNNKYGGYSHCYLSVKMEDGIHHFIFKTHGDISAFYFGATTDNRYRGNKLYCESSSCSISLGNGGGSYLFGGNGDKMKKEDFKDILPIKNGKYEMIFNIRLSTVSIRQENGNDMLLFSNVDTPLYPFIVIYDEFNFVDLIKYFKE